MILKLYRSFRWYLAIIIAFGSLIWLPAHSHADGPKESQVKVVFLYHFAAFVNWPPATYKNTNGHLRICIMGKDPFGESLDATLREKKIGNHPLEIFRNPSTASLKHCHILYMTESQSSQLKTYRQRYGITNVLTVGENDSFIQHGGMIKFFLDDQKVRFAINPDAISKTNLKVSSKLLRLAKIISP